MLVVLIALVAIVAVVVYYLQQIYFWKRRGIPGPPGLPVFGHYFELNNYDTPHGLVLAKWTKQFGKVYGIQDGVLKILVVSDTEMLQEMFIKKFEYFFARKIQATVQGSAFELTRLLADHADKGAINIHSFYQEYTMDIISQIAMGQIGSNFFHNPAVPLVKSFFSPSRNSPLFFLGSITPFTRWYLRRFYVSCGKYLGTPASRLVSQIQKAVDSKMKQREEDAARGIEPGEPNDFIDLFLDARSEDVVKTDFEQEFTRAGINVAKQLTRDEIVAQCFVFLLAGFDTTANALGYTSWLLAKTPRAMKKLQKEIDEIVGDDEEVPYESLAKLKYAENVMKEALRLYPPAAFAASRTCKRATTLGDIQIDEGMMVAADVHTIHRDSKIWGPDAEEFVPES